LNLFKKEFDMKLPIVISYALASLLISTASTAFADAKDVVIDKQQEMTQEEMDAAKKASPANEQRPAATTSQDKHSTESPKGKMIKKQMKATDKGVSDAEAASPDVEGRPAATYK
jgi:hypothetical protein